MKIQQLTVLLVIIAILGPYNYFSQECLPAEVDVTCCIQIENDIPRTTSYETQTPENLTPFHVDIFRHEYHNCPNGGRDYNAQDIDSDMDGMLNDTNNDGLVGPHHDQWLDLYFPKNIDSDLNTLRPLVIYAHPNGAVADSQNNSFAWLARADRDIMVISWESAYAGKAALPINIPHHFFMDSNAQHREDYWNFTNEDFQLVLNWVAQNILSSDGSYYGTVDPNAIFIAAQSRGTRMSFKGLDQAELPTYELDVDTNGDGTADQIVTEQMNIEGLYFTQAFPDGEWRFPNQFDEFPNEFVTGSYPDLVLAYRNTPGLITDGHDAINGRTVIEAYDCNDLVSHIYRRSTNFGSWREDLADFVKDKGSFMSSIPDNMGWHEPFTIQEPKIFNIQYAPNNSPNEANKDCEFRFKFNGNRVFKIIDAEIQALEDYNNAIPDLNLSNPEECAFIDLPVILPDGQEGPPNGVFDEDTEECIEPFAGLTDEMGPDGKYIPEDLIYDGWTETSGDFARFQIRFGNADGNSNKNTGVDCEYYLDDFNLQFDGTVHNPAFFPDIGYIVGDDSDIFLDGDENSTELCFADGNQYWVEIRANIHKNPAANFNVGNYHKWWTEWSNTVFFQGGCTTCNPPTALNFSVAPLDDKIQIENLKSGELKDDVLLEIFSLDGKLLYKESINAQNYMHYVNAQDFNHSIVLVRLSSELGTESHKVFVSH